MAYDPQKIINTANSFLLAADRAIEQRPLGHGQFQMLLVPAVVSTAFAVELYFKAIITIEKGNAKCHDLSALFKYISAKSQATLFASVQLDQAAFEQKLGVISGIFVECRYIFEQQSANLDFQFLTKLAGKASKSPMSWLTRQSTRTLSDKAAQRWLLLRYALQYHAQEKTLNLHQKKVESTHGRTLEQESRKKVLL